MENTLPWIMAALSIGAGVIYAQKGLYIPAWYWFSASSITLSVIWMAK